MEKLLIFPRQAKAVRSFITFVLGCNSRAGLLLRTGVAGFVITGVDGVSFAIRRRVSARIRRGRYYRQS